MPGPVRAHPKAVFFRLFLRWTYDKLRFAFHRAKAGKNIWLYEMQNYLQFLLPSSQTAAAKYITQVWAGITAGSLLEWKNNGHDH
jgi:hypothetical protein